MLRSLTTIVLSSVAAACLVSCGSEEPRPNSPEPAAREDVAGPDSLPETPSDLETANRKADLNVTVNARQWAWSFTYTKGGSEQTQPVWDSGSAKELPELWLVEGRSVNFALHSDDVIHSFWLPDLLFKQDVVPGRDETNFFTITPARAGTFTGRCAELCGELHSQMLFDVKVVSQAEFDGHLDELEETGQTGLRARSPGRTS